MGIKKRNATREEVEQDYHAWKEAAWPLFLKMYEMGVSEFTLKKCGTSANVVMRLDTGETISTDG